MVVVVVIASLFNKFERHLYSACAQVDAVIWAMRRHGRNESWEGVFTTYANTFEMMEEKIIQTYHLSTDPILELLGELWADLELRDERKLHNNYQTKTQCSGF